MKNLKKSTHFEIFIIIQQLLTQNIMCIFYAKEFIKKFFHMKK
jgi:hypothetical protein